MKKYLIIVLLVCFTLSIYGNTLTESRDRRYNDLVEKELNTKAFTVYQNSASNTQKFAVFTDENDKTLYFLVTTDFSRVKGYQGTTTVGVIFNDDFKVVRANIIRSQETASYVKRINTMGFMERFLNYQIGTDVEIISGATLTCRAIIESIDESLNKVKPLIAMLNKD